MKYPPSIAVPIAVLGSCAATAFTLLHYAQAHRTATPGGHLVLIIAAAFVGLLCGVGSYWASPPASSAAARAISVGLVSAFAAALFLTAIISRVNGTLP